MCVKRDVLVQVDGRVVTMDVAEVEVCTDVKQNRQRQTWIWCVLLTSVMRAFQGGEAKWCMA